MAIEINSTEALTPRPTQPASGASTHAKNSFWSEFIARAAEAVGLEPNLAVQVARQESGLNPQAVNRTSGAVGMMQLMPATAADLGVNPHNVLENVQGGIRYLRDQLAKFGDAAQALAAYNWGPRHVEEAVVRWGSEWLSHAPSETQHYVANILSRTGAKITDTASYAAALTGSTPSPTSPAAASEPTSQARRAQLRTALSAYLLGELLG